MAQLKIRLIAVQRKHIELLQIFAQALVQLKITFMHILSFGYHSTSENLIILRAMKLELLNNLITYKLIRIK